MFLDLMGLTFTEPPASSCKGIVARYRNKMFATRAGVRRVEDVQALKRQSCPGCIDCVAICDSLSEFPDALEVDSNVTDGDLVCLTMVPDDAGYHNQEDRDWHVLARCCM